VTASSATEVMEAGGSAHARDLAVSSVVVGCRTHQSPAASASPGIDLAPTNPIQPGAHGNARPPLLGICLAAPQIYDGTSSEADQ